VGSAEELEALRDVGRLKEAPRDGETAERFLTHPEAHLRTASAILDRRQDPNPGAAAMLLWDGAAFQLMAAGLQLAGYRVASSVGHHRTAIDATRVISGERGLMMRLDSLRRARDQTMYDGTPPEEDQVREALSDVEELAEWVRVAVARARGLDG
jgi:hypothetical protein